MSPITHFLAGWLVAAPAPLTRREKALVVAAAIAPDLDGFGLIPELLTRNSSHPLLWFSEYHHSLHTLAFAVVCTVAAFLVAGPLARRSGPQDNLSAPIGRHEVQGDLARPPHPWATALLVFASFHLHLLCDLVGARGPDGYQWPIPYLKPFSNAMQITWNGQWPLNAWQNFTITGALLLATLWVAWRKSSSPLELFSERAHQAFVLALRRRLQKPQL
jgi:hypothetical protein